MATVTITNGTGSTNLINDTYQVTANVNGYDNSTLNPDTVNVVEGDNLYSFTISANGTLTLHVTEDGTASGTPVVGATFVRTDAAGYSYGDAITTDSNGNAVFENVPYSTSNPPVVYFKQTASDGEHEFDDQNNETTLTPQTETIQIQNALGDSRTITLTDANYENLAIQTGTLTFTNN